MPEYNELDDLRNKLFELQQEKIDLQNQVDNLEQEKTDLEEQMSNMGDCSECERQDCSDCERRDCDGCEYLEQIDEMKDDIKKRDEEISTLRGMVDQVCPEGSDFSTLVNDHVELQAKLNAEMIKRQDLQVSVEYYKNMAHEQSEALGKKNEEIIKLRSELENRIQAELEKENG